MKPTLFAILLAVFLAAVPVPARAEGYSGGDWLLMPKKEKLFCVLASIVFLDRYRVRFDESPQSYMRWMEEMLARDARLRRKDVFQVFFQMLCVRDPGFREGLPELRRQVLSGRLSESAGAPQGKFG